MISKKKFTIGGVNQIVRRKNEDQFVNACCTSTGTFFLKHLDLVIFYELFLQFMLAQNS